MQLDDLKSEAIFNIMNTTYETAIDNISKEISNFQDTIMDLDESMAPICKVLLL